MNRWNIFFNSFRLLIFYLQKFFNTSCYYKILIINYYKKILFISIFIVIGYLIVHIYLLVSYNKLQRIKIIKNYDVYNNETDYIYLNSDLRFMALKKTLSDIENIRIKIKKLNSDMQVYNPTFVSVDQITIVIVIQVHNRIEYLAEVINSLMTVRGITRAFIVFSHDYYDEDINEMIRSIDFTSSMQIFYPYNKQMHPGTYPGEDSKYCSKDWKCVSAKGLRNATLAQVKLHWWFKINYVFNNIAVLENYRGLVMFLEDDQYFTEDLIHTAKFLEGIMAYECPECSMLSVGAERPQLYNYHPTENVMTIEEFGTTPYNMGIAFNRSTWNMIWMHGNKFCHFNDYSWTSSMRYLSRHLPDGKMYMFSIAGPRVFHIGKCGLQNPGTKCDVTQKLDFLKKFFKLIKHSLFPKGYVMRNSWHRKMDIVERGNFSDVRDQDLCAYFSRNIKSAV
ncbi:unnamed protein product [Chilo suppressalis]|uniref:Alpha-1,6-mannosyl-glycoprotein 2-beta-N-acetylglucosaminyltransferase n=1 Tax=Chilo suppressalis TaxID=168631 RepID=A0ABN8L1Q8_CHISP|nr:unnamed protein product [Chilo suppressalis]